MWAETVCGRRAETTRRPGRRRSRTRTRLVERSASSHPRLARNRRVRIWLSVEELTDTCVAAVIAQVCRLAIGDDAARDRIQHDRSICNSEDALQLVRHHYESETEV